MLGKQCLEGTITPRSSSHPTSYITINLISATMTIIIIILIIVIDDVDDDDDDDDDDADEGCCFCESAHTADSLAVSCWAKHLG